MRFAGLIVAISLFLILPIKAEEYYNKPTTNFQVQNDFAEYMSNVTTTLRKNWTPPDFLEEAHTRILFKLNRNGEVYSASILESSGNQIYDEAAINALKKSVPFENFPQNTSRQSLAINYSFDTSLVKTEQMRRYYELSKKYFIEDKQLALKYINLAIDEINGNEDCYFLYNSRGKIKEALGLHLEAKDDFEKYKTMKSKADIKRVHALKRQAEIEDSAFAYFYLAYAYEQINDYKNAIDSINKAIERTELNNNYKRYRTELTIKLK